ncbi:MAG: protein kinase [Chloroflexota bacterium]
MNRWSGQQIGKYQVQELLGRGGTGEVYKAYHAALERDVAIKTIHTFSDEPKAIERFRREAQIIAALRHPNIVQVHDFDIANDTFYMVMEHVPGQSLQGYLKPVHARGETVPLAEALKLFQTVCRAVAYAHQQGVVHADIKPANVLLNEEKQPILADFGLSRIMGRERVTSSNALTGTPAYMSPEQCMSKGSDERSDIYSLGVMLFELVTGSLPFTGDSLVAIILKHIDEPPPFPRALNPDLPPELETIILRAMEKEPGKRFQFVTDMLQALDEVLVPLGGVPSVLFDIDSPLPEGTLPCYRGLEVFEEEHAHLYFGREALVRQLLLRLEMMLDDTLPDSGQIGRFLAVLGASGSGKSSLIRAGLIPQIRAGVIEGSDSWQIRLFKPGSQPLTSLATTLGTLVTDGRLTPALLTQFLQKDGRSLSRVVQEGQPNQRLILVVDQFEEIFTLCHDENERRKFIENLLYAATVNDGPVFVLLTMRADFYHHCAAYRDLANRVANQQILVGGMNEMELRQAILQPAQQIGLRFEPGLVDKILADVAEQPGALPLLQYALLELWERRNGRLLTLRSYLASGGVQGAIAQRADDLYSHLDRVQQTTLRRIMLRLTELGDEGTRATSRRAKLAEFSTSQANVGLVTQVLRTLAEARLVTVDEETAEVAHEALIRSWPTLQEWLAEDQEGIRIHRHLSDAAHAWQSLNRDRSELYRGVRLVRSVEWAEEHADELNPVERAFLQASQDLAEAQAREAEAQRQRELAQAQELAEAERERAEAERERAEVEVRSGRRLRFFIAGLVGLLAIALGAAWFANNQQQIVDARRLAFAAQAQREVSPETAVLLAYEAVSRRHDSQSEQALRDALQNYHWRSQAFADHEDRVSAARFSPDGLRILSASWDGTALLRDTASGLVVAELMGHEDELTNGRFSPTGHFIVTTSEDATARLWDNNGTFLATLAHDDAVIDATFAPNGRELLTISADGTAVLWDSSGAKLVTFDGHEGVELTAVAFNADGSRLLLGDDDGIVTLWQRDGTQLATFSAHEEKIVAVNFHANGPEMVTGSEDFTVRVWDETGTELTPPLEHSERVTTALFHPFEPVIFTSAGRENSIRVWDLAGEELRQFHGHSRRVVTIEFSEDGETMLTSSDDGTARLWAVKGEPLAVLQGHTSQLTTAVFNWDGQTVLTASHDNTVRLWAETETPTPALIGHLNEVENTVYDPTGQFVLTASKDTTARLWSSNGEMLAEFAGHEAQVETAFFSPDLQLIITASEDGTARLWDRNGTELAVLPHDDEVKSAVFSPDGQAILTSSKDWMMRLWSLSGDLLVPIEGHDGELEMAAFGPDGQLIISAAEDNTARLWDLAGNQRAIFQHDGAVDTAFISPTGEHVLTAAEDGFIRLWDLAGNEITNFVGHDDSVERAVFSPDGSMVLTVSRDRTGRIWDLEGNEIAVLRGHSNVTKWGMFSPDNQQIVTASDDGTVRLWNLEGEQLAVLTDHDNWVATAVFSDDGKRIVTASRDHTARQFMVSIDDLMQTAVCNVVRPLTEDEIVRFDVGTPQLDFENRQCPPAYSWEK